MMRDRSSDLKIASLGVLVVIAIWFVMSLNPIAQDVNYHLFADTESRIGVPNAQNVVSNLGFVVAGIIGLMRMRRVNVSGSVFIWRFFYFSIILVGFGSAYYHWAPANNTLVWDRLPMTLGFASLTAGLVAERFGKQAGKALVIPLVASGVISVGYWWFTELAGAGDLRPYILVQYLPMIVIPLVLVLFPSATANKPYWIMLIGYIIAKCFEVNDAAVLAWTGHLVSGHTLKHLAAAAGIAMFCPRLPEAQLHCHLRIHGLY